MTVKLLVFLTIGTIAMGIPLVYMANNYGISKGKAIFLTFILTIVGTVGTFLMYYVENQCWGGLSFYGAVFLVPAVFLIVAPILRITYSKAMDFCAVGECVMLALMKVHCMMGGCCLGRTLFEMSDGTVIRFPSRLVEMAVAIILFAILFGFSRKRLKRGGLYPWYMLMYGSTRFFLNMLREVWVEKTMLLPFGNIWSLCAIVVGSAWLLIASKGNVYEEVGE